VKSLGPGRYPAQFFQRNWALIKEEITCVVKDFFRTGTMHNVINDIAVVLISKLKEAASLKDDIPINLSYVIYEVISKCMDNTLRPIFG
jgi:hypothetical protein